jgi:hypothetical protein
MFVVTRTWYDIHGRKYIDLDGLHVKVPFRYNRVTGVDVQGHIPIQDMPAGTQVKADVRTVKWDGLEYYVLKSICPMNLHCPQGPMGPVPSPVMESASRTTPT